MLASLQSVRWSKNPHIPFRKKFNGINFVSKSSASAMINSFLSHHQNTPVIISVVNDIEKMIIDKRLLNLSTGQRTTPATKLTDIYRILDANGFTDKSGNPPG
ncbi:hypothetical protein P4S72_17990 [Vibrio sp. PP-XX7]